MVEKVKLGAVLIQRQNPLKLAEFYAKAFQLDEPVATDDSHMGLGGVSRYLGFDRVDKLTEGSARTTGWFNVENCQAVFSRLIKHGATSVRKPDAECSPGELLAEVQDPEGNRIGLISQVG